MGLLSLVSKRARLVILLLSQSISDSWIKPQEGYTRKEHLQNINKTHSPMLKSICDQNFQINILRSSIYSHIFKEKKMPYFIIFLWMEVLWWTVNNPCASEPQDTLNLCTSSFEKDVLQRSQKILAFAKIAGRGLLPTLSSFSKHIFILLPLPLADDLFGSYRLKTHQLCVWISFVLSQQRQTV